MRAATCFVSAVGDSVLIDHRSGESGDLLQVPALGRAMKPNGSSGMSSQAGGLASAAGSLAPNAATLAGTEQAKQNPKQYQAALNNQDQHRETNCFGVCRKTE